jgi:hypothetical protein
MFWKRCQAKNLVTAHVSRVFSNAALSKRGLQNAVFDLA